MNDRRQHVIGKLYGYDFENIAVAGSAIGLTVSKLTTEVKPKEVLIMCETAPVRYRYDGTNPDATTGFVLYPFDTVRIKGIVNLTNIKFIKKETASAKLHVCYEK